MSDSRSAGWGFKSLCLHFLLFLIILKILWNNSNKGEKRIIKYIIKYKKFKRNKLINNNKTKNAKFNNDKK